MYIQTSRASVKKEKKEGAEERGKTRLANGFVGLHNRRLCGCVFLVRFFRRSHLFFKFSPARSLSLSPSRRFVSFERSTSVLSLSLSTPREAISLLFTGSHLEVRCL